MLRALAAVILGYILWTALWIAGNAVFFAEAANVVSNGQRYEKPGPLIATLFLSVLCSTAAGITAAKIGGNRGRGRAMAMLLGVLLLITGIAVQATAWDLLPLWYNLPFLALLLPVTVIAARLVTPRPTHQSTPPNPQGATGG